jgi:N-carbamoyl-L-amino-acid hydrolase
METAMVGIARECAASYALTVDVQPVTHMPAATMTAGILGSMEQSCDTLGLGHMRLFSYAGHAAQILSQHFPCGMIFIPSVEGIGHQPQEFTHWKDVERGANVLLQTILSLATLE